MSSQKSIDGLFFGNAARKLDIKNDDEMQAVIELAEATQAEQETVINPEGHKHLNEDAEATAEVFPVHITEPADTRVSQQFSNLQAIHAANAPSRKRGIIIPFAFGLAVTLILFMGYNVWSNHEASLDNKIASTDKAASVTAVAPIAGKTKLTFDPREEARNTLIPSTLPAFTWSKETRKMQKPEFSKAN